MKERAITRIHSKPTRHRALPWLATALALLAAGCPEPGDLEKVSSYCKPDTAIVGANNQITGCSDSPPSGGSGGSGGGSGGGASCDSACMTAVLQSSCLTCHTKSALLGDLDLESPGLVGRLKDQPAKHTGLDNPQGCPTGDKLIDSQNPTASWLLKKVAKQQGSCGTPMPPQTASPAEITCVDEYVKCVAMLPP